MAAVEQGRVTELQNYRITGLPVPLRQWGQTLIIDICQLSVFDPIVRPREDEKGLTISNFDRAPCSKGQILRFVPVRFICGIGEAVGLVCDWLHA